ncbi:MAG: ParB/RepB/Spo0J family partition protein [Treponema sp.]|jgi:ParB family chromosome partitioning protein|nr:ParB/RepB/Spo0J family partition protein [Treponema sp.]
MPKTNIIGNLALTKASDIFKSTTKKMDGETIVEIPLSELYPPEYHPFQVNDDKSMTRLAKNIKRNGVHEPGIVRPRADGGYELLCGNRRKRACEIIGKQTMPVIIRELDDDSAVLTMIDSNLEQRDKLPSEKAWSYQMKMEILNHNGVKDDMHSVEVLVEQTGESKNQIFRFIRLTELINALLDRVDTKQLAFNPAVELSYLSQTEQTAVATAMDKYEVKPSLSQAVRLKKLKQSGELTVNIIDQILAEEKKPPKSEQAGAMRFRKYFPPDYSQKQIESEIIKLLKERKEGAAI